MQSVQSLHRARPVVRVRPQTITQLLACTASPARAALAELMLLVMNVSHVEHVQLPAAVQGCGTQNLQIMYSLYVSHSLFLLSRVCNLGLQHAKASSQRPQAHATKLELQRDTCFCHSSAVLLQCQWTSGQNARPTNARATSRIQSWGIGMERTCCQDLAPRQHPCRLALPAASTPMVTTMHF